MSNFLRRLATGIGLFVFNVRHGQYEDADTRQVVPDTEIADTRFRAIADGVEVATSLLSQFTGGDIAVRELRDDVAVELRRLHSQMFALGRGGWDAVTIADRAIIEQRVRSELAFLRELMRDVAQGNVSEAELNRRLQMYINDANTSYWEGKTEAQKDAGRREEMRVLNPAEHCASCEGLAGHWEPIGTLPPPGDGSECKSNCACGMTYR